MLVDTSIIGKHCVASGNAPRQSRSAFDHVYARSIVRIIIHPSSSAKRRGILCTSTALKDSRSVTAPGADPVTESLANMSDGVHLVKEELPNDNDRPETHLMLFINGAVSALSVMHTPQLC